MSPRYITFGQITWAAVSCASPSQRAPLLKNTPFHLRFLDALLYFTDCQGFNLCHRNVLSRAWSAGDETGLSASRKKTPAYLAKAAGITHVNLNCCEEEEVLNEADNIYKHHDRRLNPWASHWKAAVRRYRLNLKNHTPSLPHIFLCHFNSLPLLKTPCAMFKLHSLPPTVTDVQTKSDLRVCPSSQLGLLAVLQCSPNRAPLRHTTPITSITVTHIKVSITSQG